MRYTLLQMVQEILSSMDSDEVNAINDTTEALQVARCIRQAYYDIAADLNLPEHHSMFELEATTDEDTPTIMYMPDGVESLIWVKYNKRTAEDTADNYQDVRYIPMKNFFDMMYQLSTDDDEVGTYTISVGSDSIPILYRDDRAPTYYTTFGNDSTVLFDSFDSEMESTLVKNKTSCYGRKSITLDLVDTATFQLDDIFFPRLLNESKVLAFAELKSVDHAIANRNARRSRNKSQAEKFRIRRESDFDQLPYFGRK